MYTSGNRRSEAVLLIVRLVSSLSFFNLGKIEEKHTLPTTRDKVVGIFSAEIRFLEVGVTSHRHFCLEPSFPS
jgi:hypothetical protein